MLAPVPEVRPQPAEVVRVQALVVLQHAPTLHAVFGLPVPHATPGPWKRAGADCVPLARQPETVLVEQAPADVQQAPPRAGHCDPHATLLPRYVSDEMAEVMP